jgi:hypothetical protein
MRAAPEIRTTIRIRAAVIASSYSQAIGRSDFFDRRRSQ